MNAKELIQTMIRLAFPIWGALFFSAVLVTYLIGGDYWGIGAISTLSFIALFCTLSIVVHYSPKELSRNQMLLRYAIHAMLILLIVVGSLKHSWEFFQSWHLLIIVPLHMVGYCLVVCFDESYTKRLSSKFKEASK